MRPSALLEEVEARIGASPPSDTDLAGLADWLAKVAPALDLTAARSEVARTGQTAIIAYRPDGPVLGLVPLPAGRATDIHGHGGWGIASVLEGTERYERFASVDAVEPVATLSLSAGDAVWWADPPHDAHRQAGTGAGALELVLLARDNRSFSERLARCREARAGYSLGQLYAGGAVERSLLEGHDGRSGARLERLRLADGTRLVEKRTTAATDLTMRLSGDTEGRELSLWSSGLLDRLPRGVGHAVLDARREDSSIVVVMRDLGDAVLGWDRPIGRDECRRIFAAMAAMHAAFAGEPVAGLCPLATRLSMFAPSGLRSLPAEQYPIAALAVRGWERFAELVPNEIAEAVAAVHRDPAPLAAALGGRGTTLAHGDPWLVNLALEPGQVVLLDWGLATRAPGAFDFATFLIGASGLPVPRDGLLAEVRRAQGEHYDDETFRLSLFAALADLGWNKALDAAEHPDPAIRARERAELDRWVRDVRPALAMT